MGPWLSQGVFPVGPASTVGHTEEASHVKITGHLQWYSTILRAICFCSRMVGDKTCSNLCTHGKTRKHAMETLYFTPDEEIRMSQAYVGKVMLTVLFNSEGPLLVEIT